MKSPPVGILLAFVVSARAFSQTPMKIVVIVETTIASATASEIEKSVAIPLERALQRLPGVRALRSTSTDSGKCRVEIEYEISPPAQGALELVKVRVLEARKDLPARASDPLVTLGRSSEP